MERSDTTCHCGHSLMDHEWGPAGSCCVSGLVTCDCPGYRPAAWTDEWPNAAPSQETGGVGGLRADADPAPDDGRGGGPAEGENGGEMSSLPLPDDAQLDDFIERSQPKHPDPAGFGGSRCDSLYIIGRRCPVSATTQPTNANMETRA